ncbi:uncharacterized protein BDR25DRAFT_300507 [Lindgomyces ingoldianus]|uniref:Uncharacterized protein n=1 Tax=Lindgomyces ingoldianus TaxID=673940 RepID=A0ACB6RBY4_9PLEO|nr:uncharacterized protein BDR25DRAFT_300507 [Lindgomyces ingoldianus]KAF2476550.1 hypothetical protein BDR25DRAFT_300507 [Lindgomyces ingoldianus]
MAYAYYLSNHRERERSYDDEDPYYSRPLVRRNSKRQRVSIYDDDDEYDDYPYPSSTKPAKPSRSLTIRQPTQLEKYNVWSEPVSHSRSHSRHDHHHESDDHSQYKYTRKTYVTRPSETLSDDESRFQLKAKMTIRRPTSSHSSKELAMAWSGDMFKRKEKWVDEDWERKERERRDSFWDDEPRLKERTIRYRKVKRTRTDEWKPLNGFRHF